MKPEQSKILQVLTLEVSKILNESIYLASRENHTHTTPLHVAAVLLASDSSNLRDFCIKSHSNLCHRLKSRALDLCFRVALDRLPKFATDASDHVNPPLSNALMAAIKRAQTNQRKGIQDQQQQILSLKVQIEQFIISILDDPSVSRVMREAKFSSLLVKDCFEQNLNSTEMPVIVTPSPGTNQTPKPWLQKQDDSEGSVKNKLQSSQTEASIEIGHAKYMNPTLLEAKMTSTVPVHGASTCVPSRVSPGNDMTSGGISGCTNCAEDAEDICSVSVTQRRQTLPHWLSRSKSNNGFEPRNQAQIKDHQSNGEKKTEELKNKCYNIDRNLQLRFHTTTDHECLNNTSLSMSRTCDLNLPAEKPMSCPRLQPHGSIKHVLSASSPYQSEGAPSTDLTLAELRLYKSSQTYEGSLDCISEESQKEFSDYQVSNLEDTIDVDDFKNLLKGLIERVGCQPEAAAAVAIAIIQRRTKFDNGFGLKGHTWLLFAGPDRIGKTKMAHALSDIIFNKNPITIRFGLQSHEDDYFNLNLRGKTMLDKIVDVVRQNQFSVVVLEDIDQADRLVQGNIKFAIERGCLPDSYGCEIGLGSMIFILTTERPHLLHKEKFKGGASTSWQLQLVVNRKTDKWNGEWKQENVRHKRVKRDGKTPMWIDLNLEARSEKHDSPESPNSSDLTSDYEQCCEDQQQSSSHLDLIDYFKKPINFMPVNFSLGPKISEAIMAKFAAIMGNGWSVKVDNEALDRISCDIWSSQIPIEEWIQKTLISSFWQLKNQQPTNTYAIVRLIVVEDNHLLRQSNSGEQPLRKNGVRSFSFLLVLNFVTSSSA